MRVLVALAAIAVCQMLVPRLNAQSVDSGFVYGGAAFGSLDGAGRFGAGLDFHLAPHFDLGGEIGLIAKNRNVGTLGSGDLAFHFVRPHSGWDPFLDGGFTAARFAGLTGLYLNLGIGANYWFVSRAALRAEFKGYAGGQDLGGFTELRFGVTFRP